MMGRTDRHARFFLRLISRCTLLYTEMIPVAALLRGDRDRLLAHRGAEHPLALQVGGAEPGPMATCAAIAEEYGFDEVNINVGCPSERVRSGSFGACLMAEPDRVAACVDAMRRRCALPITVKTRIGIDDFDTYEFLARFVRTVAQAGCGVFIVHARKAWLRGLSPRDNRRLPSLDHERVHRLKANFPHLAVVLNGGITSVGQARAHLDHPIPLDGVMIGRAVCQDPFLLAEADGVIFGRCQPPPSRLEVLERFLGYAEQELRGGVRLSQLTRHLAGLFQGQPGARYWRRALSGGDGCGELALGRIRQIAHAVQTER